MTTTTHPHHTVRRSARLAGLAGLACTASLLTAPTASASSPGMLPDAPGASSTLSASALWYVVHNPSIAKPRGDQSLPDGRTLPFRW
jgi:hypothetical protein